MSFSDVTLTCVPFRGHSPCPEHHPRGSRTSPGSARGCCCCRGAGSEPGELPAQFSLSHQPQTHQPQPQAMAAAAGRGEHLPLASFELSRAQPLLVSPSLCFSAALQDLKAQTGQPQPCRLQGDTVGKGGAPFRGDLLGVTLLLLPGCRSSFLGAFHLPKLGTPNASIHKMHLGPSGICWAGCHLAKLVSLSAFFCRCFFSLADGAVVCLLITLLFFSSPLLF